MERTAIVVLALGLAASGWRPARVTAVAAGLARPRSDEGAIRAGERFAAEGAVWPVVDLLEPEALPARGPALISSAA